MFYNLFIFLILSPSLSRALSSTIAPMKEYYIGTIQPTIRPSTYPTTLMSITSTSKSITSTSKSITSTSSNERMLKGIQNEFSDENLQGTTSTFTTKKSTISTTTMSNTFNTNSSFPNSNETITNSTNFENDTIDNKTSLVEELNALKDNIFSSVFTWADSNFPLTLRILEVARTLTDTQLKQIPGLNLFLELLSFNRFWHKMKKYDKVDYSNYTIEDVIDDFNQYHNFSVRDIPLFSNITEVITDISVLKNVLREAMSKEVNGIPVAINLMFLVEQLFTKGQFSNLGNATVIFEFGKNFTMVILPIIKFGLNSHLNKIGNHSDIIIKKLTNFTNSKVKLIGNLSLIISDKIFNNTQDFVKNIIDFSNKSLNKADDIFKNIRYIKSQQDEILKTFFDKSIKLPRKFIKEPGTVVAGIVTNYLSLVVQTVKNLSNMTKFVLG